MLFNILYLFVSLSLQAMAGTCASELEKSPEALKAIEFLRSIQGFYETENCQISIHVCEGFAPSANSTGNGQVGEILVINKIQKTEFYLPVDFLAQSTRKVRFELENGRRMFHYELWDRNPIPGEVGSYIYLFEAVKTYDLNSLEYVEFGLKNPKNSRINWQVCQLK